MSKHAPRDGLNPNTHAELDCGHSRMVFNNLRSDPTGWQTHCDVCNATRTVTASRPRAPQPTPMTREQAWGAIDNALFERHICDPNIDFPCSCPYPDDAIRFLRTEMERLEGERDRFETLFDLWQGRWQDEATKSYEANWRIVELEATIKAAKARAEAAEAKVAEWQAVAHAMLRDMPTYEELDPLRALLGQPLYISPEGFAARARLEQGDKDA